MVSLLGYAALIITVAAFSINDPRKHLAVGSVAEFLWLAFHVAMSLPSASIVSLISIVRSVSGSFMPDGPMRIATLSLLVFSLIYILKGDFGWWVVLPIVAAITDTLIVWMRDRPRLFWTGMIISEQIWIIFAIKENLLPNFLCATICIGIILFRFHKGIPERDIQMDQS